MTSLFALRGSELTELLGGSGRARAVWSSLRSGIDPFNDERVPKGARKRLKDACAASPLSLKHEVIARDGTIKLLFALEDTREIEAVLIPNDTGAGRTTLCISTQVGCARGCTFCLTATMKLQRDLDAPELVAQVATALQLAKTRALPPLRNLVLMGMGEPLDNLDAVAPALEIITDSQFGLGFGPSRITLSTVGPSPKAVLAASDLPARIAWSLHAADDQKRKQIVPTMRHSVADTRDAFAAIAKKREEPLFVEITLIHEINDRDEDAEKALSLFENFPTPVRFNLLPMNPIGDEQLKPSPPERVSRFEQILRAAGRFTMVRRARGESERAACGQLAVLTLPRVSSRATTTQKIAP